MPLSAILFIFICCWNDNSDDEDEDGDVDGDGNDGNDGHLCRLAMRADVKEWGGGDAISGPMT